MKTLTSKLFAPVTVALAIGLAGIAPAHAQTCLDNRQIQEAVSSGQIPRPLVMAMLHNV